MKLFLSNLSYDHSDSSMSNALTSVVIILPPGLDTILQPGTVMHSELSKISFENATRSVGPCKSLCRVENVIERIVEQELDSGKVCSIYS